LLVSFALAADELHVAVRAINLKEHLISCLLVEEEEPAMATSRKLAEFALNVFDGAG
jgi:hypothetical protein